MFVEFLMFLLRNVNNAALKSPKALKGNSFKLILTSNFILVKIAYLISFRKKTPDGVVTVLNAPANAVELFYT